MNLFNTTDCILKNGQNGKFNVMCILSKILEDNRHPRLQNDIRRQETPSDSKMALIVPVKGKKLMDVKIGECQAGY